MAQVPNYYYNSPWIADAARNLASALKPPDPQQQLAAQYQRFQFDQAKEKAQLDTETRLRKQDADSKFSELLAMEPVIGANGKVDENATELRARSLMGEIVKLGGVEDYYKAADAATGTASPTYAVKAGLKQQAIDAARSNMFAGFAQALGLQRNQFAQQSLIQDDQQDFSAGQQTERLDAAWQREVARLENAATIAAGKNKGAGGGTAPVVFGQLEKDVVRGVLRKIQDANKTMSRKNFDAMVALAGQYAQQTRNAQMGVNMAWEETVERQGGDSVGGTGAADVNQQRWFGGPSGYVEPTFPGAPPSLGDAAITPPVDEVPLPPPPRRATAPTAPAPTKKRKPLSEYDR